MSNRSSPIHIDFVTVMLVFGIVLLGLVMVTSASISMATKEGGDAFGYLLRQFTLVIVGSAFAAVMFTIRTEWLEKMALPLLAWMIGAIIRGPVTAGDGGATLRWLGVFLGAVLLADIALYWRIRLAHQIGRASCRERVCQYV